MSASTSSLIASDLRTHKEILSTRFNSLEASATDPPNRPGPIIDIFITESDFFLIPIAY